MKRKIRLFSIVLVFVLVIGTFGYASVLESTSNWDVDVNGNTYHHSGKTHLSSDFRSGYAYTSATESLFARRVETTFKCYDPDLSQNREYNVVLTQYYPSGVTINCQVSHYLTSSQPNAKIVKIDSTHTTYRNGNAYPSHDTHCIW